MEPYKEIVNKKEYRFFKGHAKLKYSGVRNRYLSEKYSVNHFNHSDYYAITLSDVEEISVEQFENWKPKFELNPIRNESFIVLHNGAEFNIQADVLYIHESLYENHVQVEGDSLHGDFENVLVAFKLHKVKQYIRCIPNFPTGRTELKDGELYHEFTTGILDVDGETCQTRWIREESSQIDFLSKSINSKEDTAAEEPMFQASSSINSASGCLGYAFLIPILIWICIIVWISISYHTIIPILVGIGLPLILILLGFLINVLEPYFNVISRIYGWIMNIASFLLILLILNGIGSFLWGKHWNKEKNLETDSWEQQEILPYEQANESDSIKSNEAIKREKISVKLRWSDFDNQKYQGVYSLFKSDIFRSKSNLKFLKNQSLSSFSRVYRSVYENDKECLSDLYRMLDSIRVKKSLNKLKFANTILTMVQSINYTLILEQDCDDISVFRDSELRRLRESGVECLGYAPYGLQTPIEFLSSLKGDCDTRTLLLYTIFKHFNYDVAIINSDYYGHSMLGLNVPNVTGKYKSLNGLDYYFCETTSKGFRIGQLPSEYGILNYWNIELN